MFKYYSALLLALLACSLLASGQHEVYFSFDKQSYKPERGRSDYTFSNVSLTEDRFGNTSSALFINGHPHSYFSLGTHQNIRPRQGTIALWVKLIGFIYTGKGVFFNPIIVARNSSSDDFCYAFIIGVDTNTRRVFVELTKDSTQAVMISAKQQFQFGKWTHIAITYDDQYISLYINGKLQSKTIKGYRTTFTRESMVTLGHSDNKKNHRFSRGFFDDILISNEVYTSLRINKLYTAEDPNKTHLLLKKTIGFGSVILIIVIAFWITIRRFKKIIRQKEERIKTQQRLNELEFQVVRTQMNPHFLSNSLAAIQDLVLREKKQESALYLAKFNALLRKILEYSDQLHITLKQELETIELYLELEKLRFDNQFRYSIILDETIDSQYIKVPSLICQPFVENAVWHGLLPLDQHQTPELIITVNRTNEFLTIEIRDNGVGRAVSANKRHSKGVQLVKDKLAVIQKLQPEFNYTIEFIDHTNNYIPTGTSVIIQLFHYDHITNY